MNLNKTLPLVGLVGLGGLAVLAATMPSLAQDASSAVSSAVSVGGDASAISANANGVSQGNVH